MARPAKIGLDYYPMDVGFLRDKKVRLLRAEFGASSVVFVLYVLGKVYEGDGYFLHWDKDELLLSCSELGESPSYISEVLQGCLSRSLFDKRVFQMFGVLTSAGIQRRYLKSCEKRDVIKIFLEYWLLDIESEVSANVRAKLTFFEVSGEKTIVNSPETQVNSRKNPQSKVKESKEKKRRESGATRHDPPTIEKIMEYCQEMRIQINPQQFFDYYAARGWILNNGQPVVDWKALVRSWERRELREHPSAAPVDNSSLDMDKIHTFLYGG